MQDNFIVKLPIIEKAFYNYILANNRTTPCGIYNFSLTFSAVELSISEDEVKVLLNEFVEYGKILYDEETEEIMILNWYKYNLNISRNTLICVNRELGDIKNIDFIKKFYELCKSKKYPLEIIFSGVDVDDIVILDPSEVVSGESLNSKKTTIGDIVNHFSSNVHLITPIELEDLKEWSLKLPEDVIIMAINEAVKNGVRTIKYIDGILINWHSEGLKNANDVALYLKNWQDKASKKSKVDGN